MQTISLQSLDRKRILERTDELIHEHHLDNSSLLQSLNPRELAEDYDICKSLCRSIMREIDSWEKSELLILMHLLYDALESDNSATRRLIALSMGRITAMKELDMAFFLELFLHPQESLSYRTNVEEHVRDYLTGYLTNISKEQMKIIEPELLSILGDQEISISQWLGIVYALPIMDLDKETKAWIIEKAVGLDDLEVPLLLEHMLPYTPEEELREAVAQYAYTASEKDYVAFSKVHLLSKLDPASHHHYRVKGSVDHLTSILMISNLKENVSASLKKINVNFLLYQAIRNPEKLGYKIAMHLIQMLKSDKNIYILNKVGESIIRLAYELKPDDQADIFRELFQSNLNETYQISAGTPWVLGTLLEFLEDDTYKEKTAAFRDIIKGDKEDLVINFVKTAYFALLAEPDFSERQESLLLDFFTGCAHFRKRPQHVSMDLFSEFLASHRTTKEKRGKILRLLLQKFLELMSHGDYSSLREKLIRKDLLVQIKHSLEDDEIYSYLEHAPRRPVAFFPGSFDPFSLGHEQIAKAVAKRGFDVYIAIDEFSWSKSTNANLIRREILRLSIADELHLYEVPQSLSINIANQEDLSTLRNYFKGDDVWLLMGEDVVKGASAYKGEPTEDSIHSFPHMIFTRGEDSTREETLRGLIKRFELIPLVGYDHISSTKIRDNIFDKREISELIDPLARQFIYEKDLYVNQMTKKEVLTIKEILIEKKTIALAEELRELELFAGRDFKSLLLGDELMAIILYHIDTREIIGFSLCHAMSFKSIYERQELQGYHEFISKNASGKILYIEGIYGERKSDVINETIAHGLEHDYTYAFTLLNQREDAFELFGFSHQSGGVKHFYDVDMNRPISLQLDLESMIRKPYRDHPRLIETIQEVREELLKTMSSIFPRKVLLILNQSLVYEKLLPQITRANHMGYREEVPRRLGPYLCVPFGEILKKRIIPNTITKSMHTEKYFDKDFKKWRIEAFPNYMEIPDQVNMIRSFNRDVLLVDDLLHKGYRLNRLMPLFREMDVPVKSLFVGLLSGMGKATAERYGLDVNYAYFVPRLDRWFHESKLYPFIGGDGVLDPYQGFRDSLIPSVNLILPFKNIPYMKDVSFSDQAKLSMVCLKNTRKILLCLEDLYREHRYNILYAETLGEVLEHPRYPYLGDGINIARQQKASDLVLDIEKRLERLGIL